jgi:hypothetical protein
MPGSSSKKTSIDQNKDIPSCYSDTHGIMTSTTNDIAGYRTVKNLGTIFGLTVRSRNWGADIGGLLRSSIGGELQVFTNMMVRNAVVRMATPDMWTPRVALRPSFPSSPSAAPFKDTY